MQRIYDIEYGFVDEQTFDTDRVYFVCTDDTWLVSQSAPDLKQDLPSKVMIRHAPEGWRNTCLFPEKRLKFVKQLVKFGWRLLYIRTLNGCTKVKTSVTTSEDGHLEVYKYQKPNSNNTRRPPDEQELPLDYWVSRSWVVVHPTKQVLIRVCLTVEADENNTYDWWTIHPIGWFDASVLSKYMRYEPKISAHQFDFNQCPDKELAAAINADSVTLPDLPFDNLTLEQFVDSSRDHLEPELVSLLIPLRKACQPCSESYGQYVKRIMDSSQGKIWHTGGRFFYKEKLSGHEQSSFLSFVGSKEDMGPWGENCCVLHSDGLSSMYPLSEQDARESLERHLLNVVGL